MDKDTLLKRRAADRLDTVDLDEYVVTVRGLSRGEVQAARKFEDEDARDRLIVTMAMVDPPMEPADVKEWFDVAPAGDTVKVLEKVSELSGLTEGARKSGVPTV